MASQDMRFGKKIAGIIWRSKPDDKLKIKLAFIHMSETIEKVPKYIFQLFMTNEILKVYRYTLQNNYYSQIN